jgi:hypothetical protein
MKMAKKQKTKTTKMITWMMPSQIRLDSHSLEVLLLTVFKPNNGSWSGVREALDDVDEEEATAALKMIEADIEYLRQHYKRAGVSDSLSTALLITSLFHLIDLCCSIIGIQLPRS